MKLFTYIEIDKYPFDIDFHHRLFFIGSCFTENIGQKFKRYLFKTKINPFGVLYNPISIAQAIELLIDGYHFTDRDLNFANGLWFSYYHHSKFSNTEIQKTLNSINTEAEKARQFLKQTDFLFITFGTARVYTLKTNDQIVANCHKQPPNLFNRFLLKPEQIISRYEKLFERLKNFNNKLKIIFTISPIRHIKDGYFQNNVSKSVLFLTVNQLVNSNKYYYFPAFEIIYDQLRDYRFYADDMVHLSSVAVDIIWEKIKQSMISNKAINYFNKIEKIIKAYEHKPFNKNTAEYRHFVKNTLDKIKLLKQENQNIDLEEIQIYFEKQQN